MWSLGVQFDLFLYCRLFFPLCIKTFCIILKAELSISGFKTNLWFLMCVLSYTVINQFYFPAKVNSLATGIFEWNNFQATFGNGLILWNCPQVIVTGTCWWYKSVSFGSGNGLVPSGNKPLHEPMLTQLCCITRPHWVNEHEAPVHSKNYVHCSHNMIS